MRPGAGRGDRQPGASSPEGGTTQPGWSGLGDQQGGGGLAEVSGRHRNRLAGCTQHPTVRPQPGSQASPPNLYLGLHSRTSGLSGQSQPREWRSAPASQGAGHVARGAKEAAGGSGGLLKERRGVPGQEGGALGRQSERKAGGRGRGGGQGRHASGQAAPCARRLAVLACRTGLMMQARPAVSPQHLGRGDSVRPRLPGAWDLSLICVNPHGKLQGTWTVPQGVDTEWPIRGRGH